MSTMENDEFTNLIQEIALDGFTRRDKYSFEGNSLLARLKDLGSQLWVDTGDLDRAKRLWKGELSALTTNNTLANQVVQTGVMDEEIKRAVKRIKESSSGINEEDLIFEIGFIINCKIALRLVTAFNARVSVELHPAFARDKEKSIAYARRYYSICPENFIIKIPLTPDGYLTVRELKKEGIPINYTLGFSARQNRLAASLSNPDYVNIFLGRLNAVVSDNSLGDGEYVGEAVTLATQRVLDKLKKENNNIKTSLIAASIRNGEQVISLAGVDVLTIPPKAVEEFLELDLDPSKIENSKEKVYKVGINDKDIERFNILWDVDDRFRQFTDKLLNMDIDSMSGNDLIGACEKNDVNLFYRFSEAELSKIKDHGKIPDLSRWGKDIAIDNLMTVSALQSFAKDQEALDNRIKEFI
ncbi:MAG: transaldolase family protein [Nitrospirota bacterium]